MNSLVHTKGDQGLIFREIEAERDRQDAKWGGPNHDDDHALIDWQRFIRQRLVRVPSDAEYRRDMIQIAALAVAAVESLDRKQAVRK